MPRTVRKSKGGGYDIVEPSGKKVGHSATKAKAQRSANAANAAKHGWKPTGKKGGRGR